MVLSNVLAAKSISLISTAAPFHHSYTLSLHDALPISLQDLPRSKVVTHGEERGIILPNVGNQLEELFHAPLRDRKSTRLNSSHLGISYAVFCLKKKMKLSSSGRCTRAQWGPMQ